MASPVTPIVYHLTLQHYYLVSLLSQEAHLLVIVSEGIIRFPQDGFVTKPITCIVLRLFNMMCKSYAF